MDFNLYLAISISILGLLECQMNDPNYTVKSLKEELIESKLESHNLKVIPSLCTNCTDPVLVNVNYNIIQILALSQSEEIFSISGWFTMSWIDYRLKWDPSMHGNIRQIFLPSTSLWLPDIGIMNGRHERYFDFSRQSQSRIRVSHDGVVEWMHGDILDLSCRLDVSYFPFDTQTCFIVVNPWQSNIDQILLNPHQNGKFVDNSYMPNSNISEWEIKSVKLEYKKYISQSNLTYQYILISISVQRQPLYFIILILVPFFMLNSLACLVFMLDDSGNRFSVALSLLLSLTMYVVIVSTSVPRSMRTLSVLCIYILNQLALLSVSTVLAVINERLREKYAPSIMSSIEKLKPSENDEKEYLHQKRCDVIRKQKYIKLATKLDWCGLICYIFLSFINAIICLKIMPNY